MIALLSSFMSLGTVVLLVAAWRLLQMLVEAAALAAFATILRVSPNCLHYHAVFIRYSDFALAIRLRIPK